MLLTQLHAVEDKSTANDAQHIIFFGATSAIVSQVAYSQYDLSPTHSALIGWTTAMLLGLAKEYAIDTNADSRDIRSNAIGATLGIIPIFRYKF